MLETSTTDTETPHSETGQAGVICEPHYSTGQVLLYLVMPELQVPVLPGESCVCHFSLSWSKQTKKPFVCLICLRRLVGLLSLRHCK